MELRTGVPFLYQSRDGDPHGKPQKGGNNILRYALRGDELRHHIRNKTRLCVRSLFAKHDPRGHIAGAIIEAVRLVQLSECRKCKPNGRGCTRVDLERNIHAKLFGP